MIQPAPAPEPTPAPPRPKRVRTPTVIQMEAVECGAAALAIVLGYYGRIVPLEELRLACGVSRDGSNASNISRAARAYGLVARGFRKEPASLKSMPGPMIVFWEFNHFLVVEGFGKDRVYLNDPAFGPRTVTEQEFDRSFTGLALTFEPGPDFVKGGQFPSLIRALRRRLSGSEAGLLYALLAGLCLVVPGLAIPTFSRIFVDRVLVGQFFQWVPSLLAGMALMLALLLGLSWLQQYQLLRLGQKLGLGTAGGFVWHILRLPVEFFTARYAGDIASRVQLNEQVAQFLAYQLAVNLLTTVMIGFYALVMLQINPLLALVGVGLALLNFAALRSISRRRVDANRRLQQDQGKLLSTSFSGLQMIETLKATGSEDDFFARWAGFQAKVLNAQQELGAYTQYLLVVPVFLSLLTSTALLALGGELVMAGTLTLGGLVALQYLMASFSEPITRLVNLGSEAQRMEANMNRLDDVTKYPVDSQVEGDLASPSLTAQTARLAGRLEFRNVTFGYSRLTEPLIEDFNLTLQPGDRVALVGGSGSGKSTIARLVTGLYQPWSGEILFDGQPRGIYPRPCLTGSLAMVDQEIFLFEGSVRDNLTLWGPAESEARLVHAARDACVHEDIAARPGGYDSHVEEGGANFSGGQRQRLEIARALLGDPSLLVLDEATSALDPTTEKLIDDSLRRRGCTCLIVAHRLSTIRDCDQIVVLELGKVVQRGTHEELIGVDGAYRRLIQSEEYQSDRRGSVLERL